MSKQLRRTIQRKDSNLGSIRKGESLKKDKPQSRYGRIEGVIDIESWARKRVTLIGLGSMGQPISSQLARHGVATRPPGRIRLIDGDIVSLRNLIGTEYRLHHLNRPKAIAASEIIAEINHDVSVSYWHRSIKDDDVPHVVKMATMSDLLGLFADSFDLMMEISDRCYDICPQVMALFGPDADYAEVAFSIPGATCRISETIGKRKRKTISKPTALGCDTAHISNFVASVCMRILLGEAQNTLLVPCYKNASLLIVGLRSSWIFRNQPRDILRTVVCVQTK